MKTIKNMQLPGSTSLEPQAYERDHATEARRAAAEGFVLLKNEDNILPLRVGSTVALYGSGASKTVKGGTGSGDVNERYSVSVYEGMKNAGFVISNEEWIAEYDRLYDAARQEWKKAVLAKMDGVTGSGLDFFVSYTTTPFVRPVGGAVTKTEADTAIYVLSRVAGEGADRFAEKGDYFLRDDEHDMLADICRMYENVIVLINAGVVDLSFMDEFDNIKALMVISQPGMEGGTAVSHMLTGSFTPSGKLADTWALHYSDYPTAATFSHNNGNVEKEYYNEGIYVGYRYFDTFGVPVRYGFGEGLSYTTFDVKTKNFSVESDGTVNISVEVKNTGRRPAKEVVQVYVSLPQGKLEKEYRRLCAFGKTKYIDSDEVQELTLSFTPTELASYDEAASAWVLEQGEYVIFVGTSLNNSKPTAVLTLKQDKVLTRTEHICPVQDELNTITCPADKRAEHREYLNSVCGDLPHFDYDLSAVETKTVDYTEPAPTGDEAELIVSQLSNEKLIALATGDPNKGQGSNLGAAGASVPGSAGETNDCAMDEGVANIILADGPAGLRLNQKYFVRDGYPIALPVEASMEHGFFYDEPDPEGEPMYQFCTAIPVGALLAQTWNCELLCDIGEMIGDEMERFGVTLWLAPGMNIHRDPMCGRNFEYYSEDPLLAGRFAAAITKGVQSVPGCGTTIKHFACNNQEDNRMHSDSILSERTLREIYLRGFGIVIRESHPMAIMSSYNLINGVHAANSYDLCTLAARREFGFDGLIMTDWTTTENGPDCTAAGCMRAGNDLVMPGQFSDHDSIRSALEDGTLSLNALRECITRIVRVVLRSNRYE